MDIQKPNFNIPKKPPTAPIKQVKPNNKQPFEPISSKEDTNFSLTNVNSTEQKITAPKLATSFNKKWLVVLLCLSIALIVAITCVCVLVIKKPITPKDIFITLESKDVYLDFSSLDDRITVDEDGNEYVRLLPGDDFVGKFYITSKTDTNQTTPPGSVFLRFRTYATVADNFYGSIFDCSINNSEFENWYKGLDGYLYYNKLLHPEETVSVDVKISINGERTTNNLQGKSINLVGEFEVLQSANQSYQSIAEMWQTAPYSWRTNIIKVAEGEM